MLFLSREMTNFNVLIKTPAMTERLLQFLWQLQYFNKNGLATTEGDTLRIISPGQLNKDQGPDFLQASLVAGSTRWVGSVEIHLKTTDWQKHQHEKDTHYDNVILHVVWEHDAVVNTIPVLVLQTRVSSLLLYHYEQLMQSASFIPCAGTIAEVKEMVWKSWMERLGIERLLRKAMLINQQLQEAKGHWEEVFWWQLARSFGGKLNGDCFEEIAKSIPVTLLAKHKNQIHQLEALLVGQAGLLDTVVEEKYPVMLQKEYKHLRHKYQLSPVHSPLHFFRIRPAAFPTIRLAQLAILIQRSSPLFSRVKEVSGLTDLAALFDGGVTDYWNYHYRFDQPGSFREKNTGELFIHTLIINTVCPVVFAYGAYHQQELYKQKAMQWLTDLPPEKNHVTRSFRQLGVAGATALHSQSLLELKNNYCDKRYCLSCAIGTAILKPAPPVS